ncbi:MAG: CBS domain-containing protein, partial [Actinobacteria bacterium]|nr:CBS domain-containing protein [Actinomycetota bacterium]
MQPASAKKRSFKLGERTLKQGHTGKDVRSLQRYLTRAGVPTDADGVFDPRLYHDRLLLGLQGMLSEAEWHFQRQRLDAGRQRQIAEGTYRQLLSDRQFAGVRVAEVMSSGAVTVEPGLTIARLVDEYVMARHLRGVPVMLGDRLLGIVTITDVKHVPREEWGNTYGKIGR